MRVVRATRFGGPEVLVAGEAEDPVAGPGEVVVDVSVADTLFLDIVVRRGVPGPWSVRPPYVPGFGVAGEVSSVGEGVDGSWLGRQVVAKPGRAGGGATLEEVAASFSPTGGYAEKAIVAVPNLFPIPARLDARTAVALVNDGVTAMQISGAAAIRDGERVLVMPAGGGLGNLLVQLAHAAGAQVVAAAGGPRKLEAARAAGADATVDYTSPDWLSDLRETTNGAAFDAVLDGVGGEVGLAAFGTVARGGRFFGFGSPSGTFTTVGPREAEERSVTTVNLMQLPWSPGDERRLPEKALTEAAAGRIRPLIGQTFPLAKAADAHAAMESREVVGKTLLLP